MAALIICLQLLGLLGSALTVYRLYTTGLYRRYRVFFLYFLFRVPNTIWPLIFHDTESIGYYIFWVATEPIAWVFYVAVVLELYRLILEKHQGIYTLGRRMMFLGLAVSAAISVVSLLPKWASAFSALSEQSKTMFIYLGTQRGLALGLAIFLLLMMGFLLLFTVPLSRNVVVHARIYTVFFFSKFLLFLLQSVWGVDHYTVANEVADAVTVLCVFAWFFLLTTKGEEIHTTQPILGPQHEERLLLQLDALNATLLKSAPGKNYQNLRR